MWGGNLCPRPLPPPMLGSSDTRGALDPDFQDSDACIEASLHPETPEGCPGGGQWVPSFHPGTVRPLSPREATSPGNAREPIPGSMEPAPKGLLAPGLHAGHWVQFTERGPGPGAPSVRQVVAPGSPGLGSAGSGHLGTSRAWTGLDPCGRAEPSGRRVRVGEGPEVDQDGFLIATPVVGSGLKFFTLWPK